MSMNKDIERLLKSSTYDQLEELQSTCLTENLMALAEAVEVELQSRITDVADSVNNVYQTMEDVSRNEEE